MTNPNPFNDEPPRQVRTVLGLSGGMDSATLLAWLLDRDRIVIPVVFRYPSKHNRWEIMAAAKVARHYSTSLIEIDLHPIFMPLNMLDGFNSSLILGGPDVPTGHYQDEAMRSTVVPGRNTIFLSVLFALAQVTDCDEVAIAAHAGDNAIYPDCRTEYMQAMSSAFIHASEGQVSGIQTPFLHEGWGKGQILQWGLDAHVPYELTRTCYQDQSRPCLECGACVERAEAFDDNNRADPIG